MSHDTIPPDDPGFAAATEAYTAWLGDYLELQPEGLKAKRQKMEEKGPFGFLRGTFYRWAWCFAAAEPAVRAAPRVLSVGDAHLENFGTWRDAEGRLAWGVNDFDEAAELPLTSDLVRLATSLLLAGAEDLKLAIRPAEGIAEIESGYREGLRRGEPFVLEDAHPLLRELALAGVDPVKEWRKLRDASPAGAEPEDQDLRNLLIAALPQGARALEFRPLPGKGLGSLGRARWVVVARRAGGFVAREAKATAPSAARMAEGAGLHKAADQARIAALARRAADPCHQVTEDWIIRRLSPETRKIELADIARQARRGEAKPGWVAEAQRALLHAMGAELANVHAGAAGRTRGLSRALEALGEGPAWLQRAAGAAAARARTDHAAFLRDPGVVERLPHGHARGKGGGYGA